MNAVVTRMSPSATKMIRMDHAHVGLMFHKLKPDTSAMVRRATANNICAALEVHAQLEEEIFYPALRNAGVQLEALEHSVEEHEEMRRRIAAVRAAPDGDADAGKNSALQDALNHLMRAVLHHVADEETIVLPVAEERLAAQLDDLGARMTERRLELLKPRALELAADMARANPAKTALVSVGTVLAGALVWGGLRRARSLRYSRW